MRERLPIDEPSRQPLVVGTTCLTEEEDEHEGQVLCPVCGGFGGESYGSDSGTCEECGGSCYVDENWGGEEE